MALSTGRDDYYMSNLYFSASLMGVVWNNICDAELVFIFCEWITWVPYLVAVVAFVLPSKEGTKKSFIDTQA